MADTDFCLMCGKTIGMWDKTCKYCGANQFGDSNEFYPDEKSLEAAKYLYVCTFLCKRNFVSIYVANINGYGILHIISDIKFILLSINNYFGWIHTQYITIQSQYRFFC